MDNNDNEQLIAMTIRISDGITNIAITLHNLYVVVCIGLLLLFIQQSLRGD